MKLKKKTLIYIKYLLLVIILVIAGAVYFFSSQNRHEGEMTDKYDTFEQHSEQGGSTECDNQSEENEYTKDTENNSVIYVYICGQVNEPGVKTCAQGTRLYQLIEQAGGMTETADAVKLNLADVLQDGQKIYVPEIGENSDIYMSSDTEEKPADAKKININEATQQQLMTLPGIGESKAADIIAYRTEHGKFASIEDIKKVTGIKDAAFSKIKELICV